MTAEFTMPALGADMDAGTLVEWLVAPGDRVERGTIVAVVETQKGAIDVEIFQAGTIEQLVVPVGTKVPVGTVLATLTLDDEPATSSVPSEAPPDSHGLDMTPAGPTPPASAEPRLSPRARRRAAQLGIDPSTVRGTGPSGSVTSEDIERAAASTGAEAPGDAMREAIAAAMSRSKREIPHYYLGHAIDLEPALTWLEAENRDRPVRDRVLPIALLVRAVARGLAEFPALNGWVRDGRFVPGPGVHVGLAVRLRGGGLVAPAVRDADQGTLHDLWVRVRDVTDRARRSALRASELSDATITVSSLGDRGVDLLYGVIHPPQVALVGFGTPALRPWVVDGLVRPRHVVHASLSADHRASDGHAGARFLDHVARQLATPEVL